MDENLKIIEEEVITHKDTLVLDFDKVVILRDYVIGEDDYYYYVFQDLHAKVYQSSCVGGFVPLKGFIGEEEYKRLLRLFQCNQEHYLQVQNREIK